MLLAKDVRAITGLSPETKDVVPLNLIIDEQGNPWWVAQEVCDVLGIKNTTQAVNSLDDDERAMFNIGRQGAANIINEPGLYSLILRSRKPAAGAVNIKVNAWYVTEPCYQKSTPVLKTPSWRPIISIKCRTKGKVWVTDDRSKKRCLLAKTRVQRGIRFQSGVCVGGPKKEPGKPRDGRACPKRRRENECYW